MAPLFRDGPSAFEYACKHLEYRLENGCTLPALVMDASRAVGSRVSVRTNRDGNQVALLRIPSADGGFVVVARTEGAVGPKLKPGQLVLWRAEVYSQSMGEKANDVRFGWLGVILGTLKTEHRDGDWVSDKIYLPQRVVG